MNHKIHILASGDTMLIDWHDWRRLQRYGCVKSSHGYARCVKGGKHLYWHNLVLGKKPGFKIVHKNGNRLDNRRANLIYEPIESRNNYRVIRENKTGFMGVRLHGDRFKAICRVNGKQKHIGIYKTAEQAHEAYLRAKTKYGKRA